MPGITLLKCGSQLLGDLRGGIREITSQLPVRTREQEDEDDIDQQVKEVSTTISSQYSSEVQPRCQLTS